MKSAITELIEIVEKWMCENESKNESEFKMKRFNLSFLMSQQL